MRLRIPSLVFAGTLPLAIASSPSPFPKDFAWGSATASYQIEGAYDEDGRGLSIWDTFSHTPGKTANGDTGDVADDSYHRYKEDIKLAKKMGINTFRMSISWSRIMPNGRFPLNPAGIDFYNSMIDECLAHGLEPFVTLYHWDYPQALDDEYGAWLDRKSIPDFVRYAEVCFLQFGDRVKNFITFNEPLTFINLGYNWGVHAPGRCTGCSFGGDSATEPYIAAHNVLLAHAYTVQRYRELKQASPDITQGQIGITLNCDYAEPLTDSDDDKEAAERYIEFQMGWYGDPVFYGKYPDSMVKLVGDRLPKFSKEESALLKGSWDYYGLNHYTSVYVKKPDAPPVHKSWDTDFDAQPQATDEDGKLIGPLGDSPWLHVVPWGFRKMLNWVADRYGNPGIYVTENGCDVPNESNIPLPQVLQDDFRINYYRDYIDAMAQAINDGVDVRGYMAWSLLDNYEWADGYDKRFGLHYVDYENGLKRYPKASARWYSNFIKSQGGSQQNDPGRLRNMRTVRKSAAEPPRTEPSTSRRILSSGIFSALIGFVGALALVGLFITGRSWTRHTHDAIIEQEPANIAEDIPEDLSVRTDLLSPRSALGQSSPFGSSDNLGELTGHRRAVAIAARRSANVNTRA